MVFAARGQIAAQFLHAALRDHGIVGGVDIKHGRKPRKRRVIGDRQLRKIDECARAGARDGIRIGNITDIVIFREGRVHRGGEQQQPHEAAHAGKDLKHAAHHADEGGAAHHLFAHGAGAVVARGAVEQQVLHALGVFLGQRDGDVAAHGMPGHVPGLVAQARHQGVHDILTRQFVRLLGFAGGVAEVRQVRDHAGVAARLQKFGQRLEAVGRKREAVDHKDLALRFFRLKNAVVDLVISHREKPAVFKRRFPCREGRGAKAEQQHGAEQQGDQFVAFRHVQNLSALRKFSLFDLLNSKLQPIYYNIYFSFLQYPVFCAMFFMKNA